MCKSKAQGSLHVEDANAADLHFITWCIGINKLSLIDFFNVQSSKVFHLVNYEHNKRICTKALKTPHQFCPTNLASHLNLRKVTNFKPQTLRVFFIHQCCSLGLILYVDTIAWWLQCNKRSLPLDSGGLLSYSLPNMGVNMSGKKGWSCIEFQVTDKKICMACERLMNSHHEGGLFCLT